MKRFTVKITGAAITLGAVAALALSGAVYSGDASDGHTHAPRAARVGEAAPDFTLVDQNGTKHTLSQYQGKVVVLEWTNPGCPFVVRHYESGTMVNLEKAFKTTEKDANVVWLRINSTNKDHRDYMSAKANQEWARKVGINGPILDDSKGAVGHLYGAKTTPHMFVINAKGVLVYSGAIDDDPRGSKKPGERNNYVDGILTSFTSGNTVEPFANDSYGCNVKYPKK